MKNGDAAIYETIGQEWCFCPFTWGIEDYITIESSHGLLVLCSVSKVVSGKNFGQLKRLPLTKSSLYTIEEFS